MWCVCVWQGFTGFHLACQEGHEAIVELLHTKDAKVLDQTTNDGTHPPTSSTREALLARDCMCSWFCLCVCVCVSV